MKKIIIVIGSLILLVLIILIYIRNIQHTKEMPIFSSENCPSQYELKRDYNIAICTTLSHSQDEILDQLGAKWLQNFVNADVSDELRLIEYRIDSKIVIYSVKSPNGFEIFPFGAELIYSVKPSINVENSEWRAADGHLGKDGWITKKKMYVGVKEIKTGIYQLGLLGRCISC